MNFSAGDAHLLCSQVSLSQKKTPASPLRQLTSLNLLQDVNVPMYLSLAAAVLLTLRTLLAQGGRETDSRMGSGEDKCKKKA